MTVPETYERVCRDIRGREIMPGDLLRSPHFRGPRRQMFYLYHTAVMRDGKLWGIPTAALEPTKAKGGGEFRLGCFPAQYEIIAGYDPHYVDRPTILEAAAARLAPGVTG